MTRAHWNEVYSRKALDQVSWFEPVPAQSLEWIIGTGVPQAAPIIDIGGGASTLVDELVDRGFTDLTVLDISEEVLSKVRQRLGAKGQFVSLLTRDITDFEPPKAYAVWHDRAVFHFLTEQAGRRRYREAMLRGTSPGSHAILSTFGPDGPMRCSGLNTVRYDEARLAEELGPSFLLQRSSIDYHTTPAGARQQFLHAHFIRIQPGGL
jgi:SAM-dependent methyltransferase